MGPDEGLPESSVINCDNLLTIPTALLEPEPVGSLDAAGRMALDAALRYSLDIVY